MAPTPNEGSAMGEEHTNADAPISDDSLVITGMSALMPGCRDLDEYTKKLYNMESFISDENPRWKFNHPEMTPYQGLVPDADRFDAQFFKVNYRLAHCTDVMSRKLLEQAHQAIIDAGVCPMELSGKRVGVFLAISTNEMNRIYRYYGYRSGLLGGSQAMIAHRISYWLNAKGPSYTLDASCCGSLVALEEAYNAMTHGYCDAAIVGAARVLLYPQSFIHYRRLVPLNLDGKTKCYDMNADGQTLTEAMTTLFVQKYKDARRVYAEIYHIKTDYADGLGDKYKEKFGPYRDPANVSKFLQGFYKEAGISPSSVEYVEGNGAALPEVDKAELQAIEQMFCKDRSKPLLVGSVTSNMGFAGAASGSCGVVKATLSCCGFHGTTFDIVQLHNQENFEFGMYDMCSRSSIFSNQNIKEFKRIQLMISEGISRGYVRPLSRVTYAPHDATRAFGLLAGSRHRGRVLLRMRENTTHAQPRLSLARNSCHMLLCDKDGFGISFADRLVERGVKKLYLHVPNISNYLQIKKQLWENLGVEVRIVSDHLDSIETIRKLLNQGNLFGAIEGIYVVATDLMDTETENYTNSIVLNLDVVSREVCQRLRYFAVINDDNSIGCDVCLKRKQYNLSSVSLQMKLAKCADLEVKKDKKNVPINWHSAVETIETAFLSNEAFLLAHLQPNQPTDVLREVTKIPGVVISSYTDDSTALVQVGVDQEREQEICMLLEEKRYPKGGTMIRTPGSDDGLRR